MSLKIIKGDLFEQEADCYVNAWNMNFIPWFLLLPHGVSGKLKKVAGYTPFNELLMKGIIKPGHAVMTNGGRLNKPVIHVAGLTWYWTANLEIVEKCTRNALLLAKEKNIQSIALPLIGAGVGGLKKEEVLLVMKQVAEEKEWNINIIFVEYAK